MDAPTKGEFDALRQDYNRHIQDAESGFERLSEVEDDVRKLKAEIIGDVDTGRPSFRNHMNARLDSQDKKLDKQLRWIKGVGGTIVAAVIIILIKAVFFSTLSLPWR
jgi:hypothetical protein